MLDWDGWDPRGALIFVLVGLLFPATVTLLTFEANRRMGPSVSGARSAAGSPRGASACRAQSRLIDNVITIMAMLSACSGRGTSLNRNAATTTANSGVKLLSAPEMLGPMRRLASNVSNVTVAGNNRPTRTKINAPRGSHPSQSSMNGASAEKSIAEVGMLIDAPRCGGT